MAAEEEDDDVVDLDEELHPDDVEEALDVVLRERTVAAGLEDEEDEEDEPDDRGEGEHQDRAPPAGRVPVLELLPRAAPAPARRRKADALPRLRVSRARLQRGAARRRRPGSCSRWPARRSTSGLLALVALVPLFVAWRGRAATRRRGSAFVAGVAYYAVLVSWTWYFGAIAIVPFVARARRRTGRGTGAVVGWFATRAASRSPWLIAAVWILAEASIGAVPARGLLVG